MSTRITLAVYGLCCAAFILGLCFVPEPQLAPDDETETLKLRHEEQEDLSFRIAKEWYDKLSRKYGSR